MADWLRPSKGDVWVRATYPFMHRYRRVQVGDLLRMPYEDALDLVEMGEAEFTEPPKIKPAPDQRYGTFDVGPIADQLLGKKP